MANVDKALENKAKSANAPKGVLRKISTKAWRPTELDVALVSANTHGQWHVSIVSSQAARHAVWMRQSGKQSKSFGQLKERRRNDKEEKTKARHR